MSTRNAASELGPVQPRRYRRNLCPPRDHHGRCCGGWFLGSSIAAAVGGGMWKGGEGVAKGEVAPTPVETRAVSLFVAGWAMGGQARRRRSWPSFWVD